MIAISVVFMLLGAITLYILKGVETATSEFAGLGMAAAPAIFVYAIFNTAFPKELFLRGFILKRISNKFGCVCGNSIQTIIFALLHGVMFISFAGIAKPCLLQYLQELLHILWVMLMRKLLMAQLFQAV